MKSKFIYTIMLFFLFSHLSAEAQLKNTEQIIFLNLKIIHGHISLEEIKIVKGKLKRPKKISIEQGHIYYKVLTQTDRNLYESVMQDPLHTIYEYEDEQGLLHSVMVDLDSVNFSLRLPYDASIHRVEFYKIATVPREKQYISQLSQQIGSIKIGLVRDDDE